MREAMDGQSHQPHQHASIPAGYEPAQEALMRFHRERIDALEDRDRVAQRAEVSMLVTEALSAGSLAIFVRTALGGLEPVPTDAWRPNPDEPGRQHANVTRLHQTGRSYDEPLVLIHETFTVSGIALVEQNNWVGFSRHAGKWPPYEIPVSVRLLLRFCEHRQAISEGFPLRKSDAIDWFRHNWPPEMEHLCPTSDRLHKPYNNKDKCPPLLSKFVEVAFAKSERVSGNIAAKWLKSINNRRRRIAYGTPTDAEIEAGLGIVED